MAGSTLLEEKNAPLPKALQAIGVGIVIGGSICLFLNELSNELENHFHLWNHTAQQAEDLQQELRSHPALLLGLLALFPLSAIAGIMMILPLGVYITDHAAFRALSPYRSVLNPCTILHQYRLDLHSSHRHDCARSRSSLAGLTTI
jgi:hypothetical protein